MPSVTDVQQQSSKISSNNNGKSTPPPQQQASSISTDANTNDPIIQAILMLEKKQRNLGKRKEKLESYEQEEKSGKELHKDQKEALAKYGEVIGQIECAKDIYEQLKKIQNESAKNQKRLLKQAAEEKRVQMGQRLREYAQLRYLLDHRPQSFKTEESSLLDELARVIIPSDVSLNTISRCVDTVLSIYQGGPLSSVVKNLTGRNCQEVRDLIEQLINQTESSSNEVIPNISSTTSLLPQQQQQQQETNDESSIEQQQQQQQQPLNNSNEYPLQFDTRNQNIPLQQIIQDNPFFSLDNINQDTQDNNNKQSEDTKQYYTINNSNMTGQTPTQTYTQASSGSNQQQGGNNYEQENSSNVVSSSNIQNDEQQSEEQWQQPRGNSGNSNRGGPNNGSANRNYNRGGNNNYNQQQQQNWRPRGSYFDGSYGGGQRQFNENNNRGGGGQRGGPNPNYRGHRGGNYRGGNRGGYNGNGDGYQKSGQYNDQQQQQARSGPASQQQ